MKLFIKFLPVLATFAWPFLCRAQGTLHINFDGPPVIPPNSGVHVQQYSESGMWFRPLGVVGPGNGFVRITGGPVAFFYPDNGTTYVQALVGDSLVFSFDDNSQFGLASVDLAGYSTVVPDFTVNFFGYFSDGSTITTSFSGTGINFQTYYFGSQWSSGLTRVEVPDFGSLDNLMVTPVPEPTTGALLVVGAIIFKFVRRKKTPSH